VLNNFLILYFQADASLELERRDFIRAGLEYVCLIQEVQERKKFEFVETVSTDYNFLGSLIIFFVVLPSSCSQSSTLISYNLWIG
jgi:hypothetical protein